MNQTINQLTKRKSVRVFTEKPISLESKQAILDAAIQAPTAGNMQLYAMIEISDKKIKDQLAQSCDNQPFIAQAPLVIVFCADYQRFFDGWRFFVDQNTRPPLVGDLFLAMSDALIAAQNTVVAADSMGIGSCYIGDILENYELHQKLLNLPDYVLPISMIVYGYPTVPQQNRIKPTRLDLSAVVHQNQYSSLSKEQHEYYVTQRFKLANQNLTVQQYYQDFYSRKYQAAFTVEMNRSVNQMLQRFLIKNVE